MTVRPMSEDQVRAFFGEQERAEAHRWMCGGAQRLGLMGPIQPGEFETVTSADPATGLPHLQATNSARASAVSVAPQRRASLAGTALGVISIAFGLVFMLPIVGILLSMIGIRQEPEGRGLAITGLVLNGLCIVGWALFVILGFGALLTDASSSTL